MRGKETCKSCGTRPAEWDPKRGGDMHAYSAELGHCRGCAAIEQRRLEQEQGGRPIPGTYIALQRVDRG